MHLQTKKILLLIALSFGLQQVAHANDLSFSFSSASQNTASDSSFDPNDPTLHVLGADDNDIWEHIRRGFGIPDLENPLVVSQTVAYASRPEYFQRTSERASHYLFHVVQELERRNMPTELALLPFIESAFNPNAYSSAKAAGMWQFVPSTGLDFNLKQNVFKDERRDILASTDAALTYLQKLYGMFGDWQLALAAYNWGEGSVQRAINKHKAAGLPTDFNSLSALMPAETRNYVPKLQAVKNIIATPDQYGITLPKVENQPYFVSIPKTHDIDIKVAAQLAELSVADFKALNPQFNRPIIIGDSNTRILLPENNAEKFKVNLAKWGHALSSWTAHTVTKARVKIETIAARFGTTAAVIREVNHIPPRMTLKAGSTILVPRAENSVSKDISPELAENAVMHMEPDAPIRRISVKVGKRDTLSSIARRHHVTVAQLKSWNNLSHDQLKTGQQLRIEVPGRASAPRKPGKSIKAVHIRKASAAHDPHHKAAPAASKHRKHS